jgi:acyl-CoA reductase-like NAD-dependent aldehyde dehydrogenase
MLRAMPTAFCAPPATGAALRADPDVDKISFTGSTEVGRLIVKAAAGNLNRDHLNKLLDLYCSRMFH